MPCSSAMVRIQRSDLMDMLVVPGDKAALATRAYYCTHPPGFGSFLWRRLLDKLGAGGKQLVAAHPFQLKLRSGLCVGIVLHQLAGAVKLFAVGRNQNVARLQAGVPGGAIAVNANDARPRLQVFLGSDLKADIGQFGANPAALDAAVFNDLFRDFADRKSTRLNSSHVAISYAV